MGANKREDATRPFHDMVVAKWAGRAQALKDEIERDPAQADRIARGDPAPV
jgi:hypothetical protein